MSGSDQGATLAPPRPKGRGDGSRKPGRTPKGRQVDPSALADVQALLTDRSRKRDLLIEHRI